MIKTSLSAIAALTLLTPACGKKKITPAAATNALPTMIDHISFGVADYEKSLAFYDATLPALGYKRLFSIDMPDKDGGQLRVAGYGKDGKPSFWVSPHDNGDPHPQDETVGKARGVHVCFIAHSVDEVKNWYNACLKHGGTDNGKPGPRPHYHPGFYGAFIIDPSGWRIEACVHNYKA